MRIGGYCPFIRDTIQALAPSLLHAGEGGGASGKKKASRSLMAAGLFLFISAEAALTLKEAGPAALCVLWQNQKLVSGLTSRGLAGRG